MVEPSKLHTLREHLALISTEVYLLMRSQDEDERINRYNTVQHEIDAILELTENTSYTRAPDKDCHR